MQTRTALIMLTAGTLFCAAHAVQAQTINYNTVVQIINGSAEVSGIGQDEFDTDSFSFSDFTPTPNNVAYQIDAVVEPAAITINGSLTSTFAPNGFAIDALTQAVVTSPAAFEGTFRDGSFEIEALALVRFTVTEPTEVEWSLTTQTYGGFFREDQFESYAFFGFGNPGGTASGTQILAPGVYVFDGGINLEFDDAAGFFTDAASTDISFALTVIPTAGVLPTFALAGLMATRRRRPPR